MTTKLKTKPCGTCGGTGTLPADNVGEVLREEREKADPPITRQALAEAMAISPTYLRDLETGTRRFSNELLANYQRALEMLIDG